ncbi:hypothetical protein CEXT_785421 [Caerostris extrusa]|uniref:Uncharacterized protein n=1 Tax=Caerostris extrusa TaxID=172846 RepID=A0AAV4NU44_CAEEX|nr:hypothetical protein CEXT_785421 [Caerostris extrusa]
MGSYPLFKYRRVIKEHMYKKSRPNEADQIKEKCWRKSLLQHPAAPRRHAVGAFGLETGNRNLSWLLVENKAFCNHRRLEPLNVTLMVLFYSDFWEE